MRWYWTVNCDNTIADPLVVDSHNLCGIDPEALSAGRPITGWPAEAYLKTSKRKNDGDPDDVLQNHLGVPVYSPRLRLALKDAGIVGFQFLPVRVYRPSGQSYEGFSIANVIELRPALDRTSSHIEVFPPDYFLPARRGLIRSLRTPVLRQNVLVGCDVVRLEEYPSSVYVSQRFKDVFDAGRFTGYSLHEVGTS
jgi:hypothetical protein